MALQEGKVLLVCGLLLVLVFAMVHSNDMKDDEYSEIGKPPQSGDFTVKEKLQVKKRKKRSYGFSSFAFSARRRHRHRRWKLSVCILTTFV